MADTPSRAVYLDPSRLDGTGHRLQPRDCLLFANAISFPLQLRRIYESEYFRNALSRTGVSKFSNKTNIINQINFREMNSYFDNMKNGEAIDFNAKIKQYLDRKAEEDSDFAEKYANPKKSVSECCNYIIQEVRKYSKNKNVGLPAEAVYGAAVHYYDEEEIEVDAKAAVGVSVSAAKEPEKPQEKPKRGRKKKEKAVEAPTENYDEYTIDIPLF